MTVSCWPTVPSPCDSRGEEKRRGVESLSASFASVVWAFPDEQARAGDGFQARLRPGAHHYTFLESIDPPMGFQGIDEFMEALIALPDGLDARLAVPPAG